MDYGKRIKALRKTAADKKAEAFMVSGPENIYYLSGLRSSSCLLLVTMRGKYLFTDFRYFEQAQLYSPRWTLVKMEKDLPAEVAALIARLKIAKVAFESELTYRQWSAFKKTLRGVRLLPCDKLGSKIRSVKDDDEIRLIERAAEVTDEVLREITVFMKPGMSEKELAWKIESCLHEKGADGPAFPVIAAFGENTAHPHAVPTQRKLKKGDFVLLDFGAEVQGYRADCTRTFAMGKPSREQKQRYMLVKEAQAIALACLKSGISASLPDTRVREEFARHGLESHFGHGLGHGLGLEIHEAPTLGPRSVEILRPGMAFTIEPGLYFPGWGGIRIEDTVVLTGKGPRTLTNFTKELLVL